MQLDFSDELNSQQNERPLVKALVLLITRYLLDLQAADTPPDNGVILQRLACSLRHAGHRRFGHVGGYTRFLGDQFIDLTRQCTFCCEY